MKRSLKLLKNTERLSLTSRVASSTSLSLRVQKLVPLVVRSSPIRQQPNPLYAYLSSKTSTKTATSTLGDNSSNKTVGDLFLDNLGNIFFAIIAVIILSLVRASKGSTNKMSLRDWIEQTSALDPLEMEDLRLANAEFTPEVFRNLLDKTRRRFPQGLASYSEFVAFIKQELQAIKGEEFTIQLGYLLDRVVSKIIEADANSVSQTFGNESGTTDDNRNDPRNEVTLNLSLLFVILSLSLHGSVRERVHILFDIMKNEDKLIEAESTDSIHVNESQIIDMINYLQQTCQLVPDCQIVESEIKYPIQEYRIGTPLELSAKGKAFKKKDLSLESHENLWTCNDFHHLLRSKSVCAWGECYVKKQSLD